MGNVFDEIDVEAGCLGCEIGPCAHNEAVLRHYAYYNNEAMPPMTDAQREWCLEQIDAVEGFSSDDYPEATDADLAHGVLRAWQTFCRDKGLL